MRASKYTDDSAITAFIKGVFADTIESLQEQLDGKIQTWSQDTDPALEWTETEEIPWTDIDGNSILDVGGNEILIVWEKGKYIHKGDLWQNTANNANTRWRWDGNEWVEQKAPDYLFDKMMEKRQFILNSLSHHTTWEISGSHQKQTAKLYQNSG